MVTKIFVMVYDRINVVKRHDQRFFHKCQFLVNFALVSPNGRLLILRSVITTSPIFCRVSTAGRMVSIVASAPETIVPRLGQHQS